MKRVRSNTAYTNSLNLTRGALIKLHGHGLDMNNVLHLCAVRFLLEMKSTI